MSSQSVILQATLGRTYLTYVIVPLLEQSTVLIPYSSVQQQSRQPKHKHTEHLSLTGCVTKTHVVADLQ